MSTSLHHNLMAANTSRTLTSHYGRLSDSVRHLSTGLRVERAADDASGLAIRELMRADMASLYQGARNINDAISLIQTADGALGVIDEKLIRMKELAEQAATGTYDSTQRLMIDSEFQQMASEIERIARATDFNGIHLLDGSLSGTHNGKSLTSTGALKVHFGTANDSAEDYYYVEIGDCTTAGLGLRQMDSVTENNKTDSLINTKVKAAATPVNGWWDEAVFDYTTHTVVLNIPYRAAGVDDNSPAAVAGIKGIDYYQLPVGLKNVTITSNAATRQVAHKPHVCLFTKNGTQITGPSMPYNPQTTWEPRVAHDGRTHAYSTMDWWTNQNAGDILRAGIKAGIFNKNAIFSNQTIYHAGETYTGQGFTVTMITDQNEIGSSAGTWYGDPANTPKTDEIIFVDEISADLVFAIGGHGPPANSNCNKYTLRIEAEFTDDFIDYIQGNQQNPPDPSTPNPPQGDIISIKTQEEAQQALERIDNAIVKKDTVRAHLGAVQNRLENTVTNINIQAENLQSAESRISDADIATEMTNFARTQILSQTAVSMLAQANSFPHMLMELIEG